jgi:hypothetical protein
LGILTKIFIVSLVVLILIACPIFIRQATVAPSWRSAYQTCLANAEAAKQNAQLMALGAQQLGQQYAQLQQEYARDAASRQIQLDEQAGQLVLVRQENARLSGELQALTVELGRLRADYETNTKRTELLAQQRQEAFAQLETLNEESRRLSDQFQQLQLEAERQREIGRMLNEQLVEREERIRQLEQMIAGGGGAVPAAPSAAAAPAEAPSITGTVTGIKDNLASVNIGSAKGIKAGMQLVVYRGPEFVAHLRVQDVRVDESAGLIADQRLEVQQGDKVTTRL